MLGINDVKKAEPTLRDADFSGKNRTPLSVGLLAWHPIYMMLFR
jgi:hypothetical protein